MEGRREGVGSCSERVLTRAHSPCSFSGSRCPLERHLHLRRTSLVARLAGRHTRAQGTAPQPTRAPASSTSSASSSRPTRTTRLTLPTPTSTSSGPTSSRSSSRPAAAPSTPSRPPSSTRPARAAGPLARSASASPPRPAWCVPSSRSRARLAPCLSLTLPFLSTDKVRARLLLPVCAALPRARRPGHQVAQVPRLPRVRRRLSSSFNPETLD